jgi:hypothetical protein
MTVRSANGAGRDGLFFAVLVGSLLATGNCWADNSWGNSRSAWASGRNAWGSTPNAWGSNPNAWGSVPNAWGTAPSPKGTQRGHYGGGRKGSDEGSIGKQMPEAMVANRLMAPPSLQYRDTGAIPDALQIAGTQKYRPRLLRRVTARAHEK